MSSVWGEFGLRGLGIGIIVGRGILRLGEVMVEDEDWVRGILIVFREMWDK